MKRNLIILAALFSLNVMGNVPDVVITTLTSANSYGTIAGKLKSKPDGPVGISVQNGNILYSTISDQEGRWGIVIRHLSTQVSVNSWSLTNPTDRGAEIVVVADSFLPWNRSVTARGSSSSETSAKYQTENSLRNEINRERTNCSYDKGVFSHSGGPIYCYKTGSTYNCSVTASCSCRQ